MIDKKIRPVLVVLNSLSTFQLFPPAIEVQLCMVVTPLQKYNCVMFAWYLDPPINIGSQLAR